MRILVFLKEVPDVRVPVEYDEATGIIKDEWNIAVVDPEGKAALNAALAIRDRIPGTKVTAIYLAPPTGVGLLRSALSMGCDEAIRIWDEAPHAWGEGLDNLHSQGKALIFAQIARILGYDLILMGTSSPDKASGQSGILLASYLDIPVVSAVVNFHVTNALVKAVKMLDEGFVQHIETSLPAAICMNAGNDESRYPSFPALYETANKQIPCWNLSDIGLPESALNDIERLEYSPVKFPVPRPLYIPAPDSSLTGFERREQLRAGTMKKREGGLVEGEENAVVEQIFQTLLNQGWLNHLKKDS
jgi:electron transfer flavoprotein beta subunit